MLVELKTCAICHRVYSARTSIDFCPNCQIYLENKFREVRNYIREKKNANTADVLEACHVSQEQLHQWIREERIEYREPAKIGISCISCGDMITKGYYCEKCKKSAAFHSKKMNNVAETTKVRKEQISAENGRMRYLDSEKLTRETKAKKSE